MIRSIWQCSNSSYDAQTTFRVRPEQAQKEQLQTSGSDLHVTWICWIKKQSYHFANKGPCRQSYGFSSSHVWMSEFYHQEGWLRKNWCFWTVLLETLESPLDSKEITPVNPKGNQPWIYIGGTDAEAEAPILWPLDVNRLIRKDPDAWKDWRQEETGTKEDETVGWHEGFNGHELEEKLQEIVKGREPWHTAVHGVTRSRTWHRLNNNKALLQLFHPLNSFPWLCVAFLQNSWWRRGKTWACFTN